MASDDVAKAKAGRQVCPTCGSPMQSWPALDGPGYVTICPHCPAGVSAESAERPATTEGLEPVDRTAEVQGPPRRGAQDGPPPTAEIQSPDRSIKEPYSQGPGAEPVRTQGEGSSQPERTTGSDRFRELIAQAKETSPKDQWPESLLEDLPEEARHLLAGKTAPPPTKEAAEVPEEVASSLRAQGYVIDEDSRGLRISGSPTVRSSGMTGLSASDVVRLAADLDGGVLPPEKRLHCPKCDAVVPPNSLRCQWCDTPISPGPSTETRA